MAFLVGAAMVVVAVLLLLGSCLLKWNEVRYSSRKCLPPGTMGWPLFGETTEFLKQGPSFLKHRRLRHGNLFKTHILGCPTVVCMDPEVNRYILMNESKGFLPGYPQSMLDILGKCNIAAVHGSLHKTMRGVMLGLINPSAIRDQLLPKMDEFMSAHLSNWGGKLIDIQEKTKEMVLLSALRQIASIEAGSLSEALKTDLFQLVLGTISLPINFPGTSYNQGLRARKRLVEKLRGIIEERRASRVSKNDMLDSLLWSDDCEKRKLSDEQMIDMIITLVYSGYETVSTTCMMAIKYLLDHPAALEELRNEHLSIRKGKTSSNAVDWNDFKSMHFTRAVILETLRLATVVNGVLRRTTHDVEMKGYIIPKGWRIYVYTREINYDQHIYPDPLAFNPWKWLHKNLDSHPHFMIFGGGGRLCPGKELGIAEIAMFLHYFVTRYRWEEEGKNTIMKFPRLKAPGGMLIRVHELR